MNLTQKMILALGVAAAASVSFAQMSSTGAAPAGVLGQRYTEVGLGLTDINHVSSNLYTIDASVNAPVGTFADVNAGYSYDWIKGKVRAHANTVWAGGRVFTSLQGVKPFAGVDVGYQFVHALGDHSENAVFDAKAGVEVPVGPVTLTPRIVYHDDFQNKNESSQDWTYEVEGNYWVTRQLGAFASVGYSDVRHSSFDSWNYKAGVRFKF